LIDISYEEVRKVNAEIEKEREEDSRQEKQPFVSPQLIDYGAMEDVTLGSNTSVGWATY